MEDDEKKFSLTNFFIKGIIIIILILFGLWLISISQKKSDSKEITNDDVFASNMEAMKEVGKSYFTTERLPKKIGDFKVLTLEEMYEKKLILTLKDKDGKACSADSSYVSVEKYDDEYQMKVYLECGDSSDYIIVIMGCYDYCENTICEKQATNEESNSKGNSSKKDDNSSYSKGEESSKSIEYEYIKTTGGKWSEWGEWSSYARASVVETTYRQVEVKKENVEYTYSSEETVSKYVGKTECPVVDGYTLSNNDGNTCTYNKTTTDTKTPSCAAMSGYTVTRSGFTCTYSKTVTDKINATCPVVDGYTLIGSSDGICTYNKTTTETKTPSCAAMSGYTVTRSGFTCTYSKTTTETKTPSCAAMSGYTVTRSGGVCNYKSTSSTYTYYSTGSGSYVPSDTSTYHYVQTSADYKYVCNNSCAMQWYYTYKIYKISYATISKDATCTSGYTLSNGTCVKSVTTKVTKNATCSDGYTKSNNTCIKTITDEITRNATCSDDYTLSNGFCIKNTTDTVTRNATCSDSYTKSNNSCVKTTTDTITKNAICSNNQYIKNGSCYEDVVEEKITTGVKEVTYYRYRLREYIGGSVSYKWSSSNNDEKLIKDGYKLSGRTR